MGQEVVALMCGCDGTDAVMMVLVLHQRMGLLVRQVVAVAVLVVRQCGQRRRRRGGRVVQMAGAVAVMMMVVAAAVAVMVVAEETVEVVVELLVVLVRQQLRRLRQADHLVWEQRTRGHATAAAANADEAGLDVVSAVCRSGRGCSANTGGCGCVVVVAADAAAGADRRGTGRAAAAAVQRLHAAVLLQQCCHVAAGSVAAIHRICVVWTGTRTLLTHTLWRIQSNALFTRSHGWLLLCADEHDDWQ